MAHATTNTLREQLLARLGSAGGLDQRASELVLAAYGVQLITIDYAEPLTATHIQMRLRSAVPSLPQP
jgi:hypothetical protein